MVDNFKVLTDAEHILLRSGMYIGSLTEEPHTRVFDCEYKTLSYVPGLIKIINEVIDNSIDEAIRTDFKFANKINITITNDYVEVTDNGRGIPVISPEGETDPIPVLAWTRARAGTNFDDEEGRTTLGMNGVGSFATNVFSSKFIGTSSDGKLSVKVTSINNAHTTTYKVSKSATKGVSVKFYPDLQRFGLSTITEDHKNVIHDRLTNLAVAFPNIVFRFNGLTLKFKNLKAYAAGFGAVNVAYQDDNNVLVITSTGPDGNNRIMSYVNGLSCPRGGVHIDYLNTQITMRLREMIKKKHKIDVLPAGIMAHLQLVTIIRNFPNPSFDSQTKERLTNPTKDAAAYLEGINFDLICKKIFADDYLLMPIIETQLMKKEMAERREAAKKSKANSKKKVASHLPANSKDREKCTLYLTEGLSAISNFINVRDSDTMGAFPLRGKPKNINGMKVADILKNEELSNIVSILGLTIGEKAVDLNYGRIVIMPDADVDGKSICGLLINFFALWPELFIEGRVFIMQSPIVIATKARSVKRFFTQEDYAAEQPKLEGYKIEYNKGLGSLTEDEYDRMVNQPVLQQVVYDDKAAASLEMAFGDNADLRKAWLLGE